MDASLLTFGLRLIVLLAALIAAGFSTSDCYAQQRTWTDVTGSFTLEAELIEVNETEKVFTNPDHSLTEAYITGRFG